MSAKKTPLRAWVETTDETPWRSMPLSKAGTRGSASLRCTGGRDQTWRGFGGCFNELGWIALQDLAAKDRKTVLDALFDAEDGCRFSVCRLPIGASDYGAEWYSHDEHDGDFEMKRFSIARDREHLLPYIREGLKRRPDMQLFASPWSPPTWMKHPKAYNYGTLIWTKKHLSAYARYFSMFVEHYAREGVPIRQIHPQNEPVADQKFPSCLWTGDRLLEFIGKYLGPEFERRGLDTEIWLGTLNTDDYDGYPLAVLADKTARKYVSGVGFQWAGKAIVRRVHESFPDMRLMQTENECGDGANTWEYAAYVFDLVRNYVSDGVESYVYWNMVLREGGESTWGWRQNSMVTVDPKRKKATFRPEFFVMKHFSRFIDEGATRLDLSGEWAGNAVAFENPDGATAVVARNPLSKKRRLVVETPPTENGGRRKVSVPVAAGAMVSLVVEPER